MKVAGNKVRHIADLYFSELKNLYAESEIEAILYSSLEFYLGINRSKINLRSEENVNQSDLLKLYKCFESLRSGLPLQYIISEVWFYNLKLFVNESVLIPRPETEEMVDLIIKQNVLAEKSGSGCKNFLDIGTGSGCIPLSVKANIKDCNVYACDISAAALAVAKKNAESNNLQINFFEADVLNTDQFIKKADHKFNVIVSNPPYIKLSEKSSLSKNVIDHEPHLALFVEEDDSIIFYKEIIDACKYILADNGYLYFELNPLTAVDVKDYALKSNLFSSVELIKDMSRKIRFLRGVKREMPS